MTTRRRGAELEAAILTAGWDELVEVGYARLTMGSVATRAHTSEPVLYRRWANKDQLVLAALEHRRAENPVRSADTGTLRGDLVEELVAVGEARAGLFAIAMASAFAGLLADTGLTPVQVRAQIMPDLPVPSERPVYQRATVRGEIDPARVPAAVFAMPFDLVRQDLLMDLVRPSRARVESIVDELFLPLVAHHMR